MIGGTGSGGGFQQQQQQQSAANADQDNGLLSQNLLFRGDEAFLLDSFFSSLEETDSLANIVPFGLDMSNLPSSSSPTNSTLMFSIPDQNHKYHSSHTSLNKQQPNHLLGKLQIDPSITMSAGGGPNSCSSTSSSVLQSPHGLHLSNSTFLQPHNSITSPTAETACNEAFFGQKGSSSSSNPHVHPAFANNRPSSMSHSNFSTNQDDTTFFPTSKSGGIHQFPFQGQNQYSQQQPYYTQRDQQNLSPLSPSVNSGGISPNVIHEGLLPLSQALHNLAMQQNQIHQEGRSPHPVAGNIISGQLTPPQDASLQGTMNPGSIKIAASSSITDPHLPSPQISQSSLGSSGTVSTTRSNPTPHIPTTHPDTLFIQGYAQTDEQLQRQSRRKSQATHVQSLHHQPINQMVDSSVHTGDNSPSHRDDDTTNTKRSISKQSKSSRRSEQHPAMFPSTRRSREHPHLESPGGVIEESLTQSSNDAINQEEQQPTAPRKRGRPRKIQTVPAIAQAAIAGQLPPPPPLSSRRLSSTTNPASSSQHEATASDNAIKSKKRASLEKRDGKKSANEASSSQADDADAPPVKKARRGRPALNPPNGDPNSRELLSESQKRANHVASEQKRREMIRNGFQALVNLTPTLKDAGPLPNGPGNTSSGHSKSDILFKVAEYIEELHREVAYLRSKLSLDDQEHYDAQQSRRNDAESDDDDDETSVDEGSSEV